MVLSLSQHGMIKVLPPKTTKEVVARERERKAKTTLLMALLKDHLAKIHKMADAKEMWEAIKSRFGGNDESKKMQKFQTLLSQLEIHGAGVSHDDANQKFLRSLPSSWSQVALIKRIKPGLDTLSFDDLYNNLRVSEHDVKGTTASSSSNTHNVAFVSIDNTSNTNDVSTAYSVSSPSVSKSKKEGSASYTVEVIHSFFANQSSAPQLDCNDLEQINDDDLEEMDLKWQRRDGGYNGNKARDNGRRPTYQDDSKALVTIDGHAIDWSGHVEEDTQNFAMMAYSSSNSGSDNEDDPHKALKDKEIVDSGCSRHMIGNKAYLADYQQFNGGSVAFGGSNGRITGKGKIKAVRLDFEDVYYVEELKHYNLFSVSQIYDKKNKVLFTDTDCLVLSPDFELPDENQKGKQHKASCKDKTVSSVNQPLQILHIDLFGLTSVRSINHKTYCLVITDGFSRFSWVYFLKSKDETTPILQDFIRQAENQFNHKVKTIRSDNRTKSKNHDLIEFRGSKGIKREYSNARTPQQNRVTERKNMTLIKAARTMLADSFLPTTFWAEAVNTAFYVLDRVLVTKPQNKTPYVILTGRQPIISYLRPFGCHVTILNTIDQLGKFDRKSNLGFLVGYSLNSKDFRVYNLETKRVEENMHVNFLENKPDVAGKRHAWMFDLDYLTNSMNYKPVLLENQANKSAGPQEANNSVGTQANDDQGRAPDANTNSTILLNAVSEPVSVVGPSKALNDVEPSYPDDPSMAHLEDIFASPSEGIFTNSSYDDEGVVTDFNNLETTMNVCPTPTTRIHSIHPKTQILRDLMSAVQTRSKVENSEVHALEEGIDYDEVFAHVVRIEAIRIFLAFTSYMSFIVYQIDVKSVFLYGTIDEEVYVTQPPGFVEPKFHNKVYNFVKALYGLHQAPRAWYATLSTFLERSRYRRRAIDRTLFIKQDKIDIMLVKVYVDDIIFGSTKLQVKQKEDGIFISQDKYVAKILKNFDFLNVKTASTPIETQKPLVKDEEAVDVDVHLYRSMIGSLMYLNASRPDIMFAVCACSRFQVTPKSSHLQAVNRIFRYLKGQPKLDLWYPKVSSFNLEAYLDSDYAGANLDRKSTTGATLLKGRLLEVTTAEHSLLLPSIGVNTYRCDEDSLELKELMVFFVQFVLRKMELELLVVKTVNDQVRVQALIDAKRVNIKETSIRHTIKLDDEEGTSCLANDEIFTGLANMGYEKIYDKLTFYKAFFSPQWSTMASTIICIAANQKFNFSRDISHHQDIYDNPSLTKKVFANMKRVGTSFFGVITPLFENMLVPAAEEVGQAQDDVSIPTEPSTSKPYKKHKSKKQKPIAPKVPSPKPSPEHQLPSPSNDPILTTKDSLKLQELMDLCTRLSNKVLDLESKVIDIFYRQD
uniref:Retrovirus-related Pol polyprotein from transposon TNT 1-94 n=1 Tax=Tanacetum cinerariifolium TaxID=118510 RepID=A0A6L2M0I7_TANCI|nr:retrovirus-related Pol polyprotein from transposon TNT 1-94 [Tanacetum cinerariifolium]